MIMRIMLTKKQKNGMAAGFPPIKIPLYHVNWNPEKSIKIKKGPVLISGYTSRS
jgi:hypothetical protein